MDRSFFITLENGKNVKCDILHTFMHGKNGYIFYNDGTVKEDGTLEVLSSKFIIKNRKIVLLPIEEDEWDIVNKEWSKIYE